MYFAKSPESKPPKEFENEMQSMLSPFRNRNCSPRKKCSPKKCSPRKYCLVPCDEHRDKECCKREKSPEKNRYRNKQIVITRREEICSPKKDHDGCEEDKKCNNEKKRYVKNYKYEIKESSNLSNLPM